MSSVEAGALFVGRDAYRPMLGFEASLLPAESGRIAVPGGVVMPNKSDDTCDVVVVRLSV